MAEWDWKAECQEDQQLQLFLSSGHCVEGSFLDYNSYSGLVFICVQGSENVARVDEKCIVAVVQVG